VAALQLSHPLEDTLQRVRELGLPLIIDGSGLNFIATRLHLIKGYSNCILTPNIAELGRLAQGAGVQLEGPMSTQWQKHVSLLSHISLGWFARVPSFACLFAAKLGR
jgi:NAD(P)H-hydrate repair Nnr-like enzyme with NAD(P)H-hydrate dehydratase domain